MGWCWCLYKDFALGSQPIVQKSDAKLAIEQLIMQETFSRYLRTLTGLVFWVLHMMDGSCVMLASVSSVPVFTGSWIKPKYPCWSNCALTECPLISIFIYLLIHWLLGNYSSSENTSSYYLTVNMNLYSAKINKSSIISVDYDAHIWDGFNRDMAWIRQGHEFYTSEVRYWIRCNMIGCIFWSILVS